jgi:hypothetical protein
MGGSFNLSKIDVCDISTFGDNKILSDASALAHELVEQNAKQKEGLNYARAHERALLAEEMITGYLRKGEESYTTQNIDRTYSGKAILVYTKDGKTFTVTLNLNHNNISKVE